MSETGTGSLEPGIASGEIFWIKYPSPALEYFYAAQRSGCRGCYGCPPVARSALCAVCVTASELDSPKKQGFICRAVVAPGATASDALDALSAPGTR